MVKYLRKYRIYCEWDRRNLEPIKEDTYIPCLKGGQIYRVNNEVLAYYKAKRGNSKQLIKKLSDIGVKWTEDHSTDGDILIYFREYDLDILAKEVGASQNGVNIKPWSVKNLRKLKWFKDNKQYYIDNRYYSEMSEEDKEILRERLKIASKVAIIMTFFMLLISFFILSIYSSSYFEDIISLIFLVLPESPIPTINLFLIAFLMFLISTLPLFLLI